jgi:hypothetical protein
MTEPADPESQAAEPRSCPWCSEPARDEDTRCRACGAALAQRESIADLVIPGVTTVDPALAYLDSQPIRLRGPSPSQGMASGVILAAAAGGPAGLAAIGGLAAVAAVEYFGTKGDGSGGPVDLVSVGKPSGATLMALERLEREGEPVLDHPPDADSEDALPAASHSEEPTEPR